MDNEMLTEKQIEKLRSEIVLGSLYTQDYENSLGVCPISVQEFFDSYITYKWGDAEEEGLETLEELDSYDKTTDMYDFYCCFEDDPLLIDRVYVWMLENRVPFTVERYNNYCNQKDVILDE